MQEELACVFGKSNAQASASMAFASLMPKMVWLMVCMPSLGGLG